MKFSSSHNTVNSTIPQMARNIESSVAYSRIQHRQPPYGPDPGLFPDPTKQCTSDGSRLAERDGTLLKLCNVILLILRSKYFLIGGPMAHRMTPQKSVHSAHEFQLVQHHTLALWSMHSSPVRIDTAAATCLSLSSLHILLSLRCAKAREANESARPVG